MNLTPFKTWTPDLRTPAAQQFWAEIVAKDDPFPHDSLLVSEEGADCLDLIDVGSWGETFKKNGVPLLEPNKRPYLPIETFKWFPDIMPMPESVRQFRSSGTTMKDRSVSKFSPDGYELYRGVSLFTFYKTLSRFFASPEAVPGFSLVPPTSAWPESSLAQMVEWIGDWSSVTYMGAGGIERIRKEKRPIWIFGTGFHFVELLDGEKKYPLPPGSLVIETGGTKGRTREISRLEYLDLLGTGFEIEPWQILSEYGMAELASQAYEWLEPGQNHSERKMRFPWWVEVSCMNHLGQMQDTGFGALTVLDRARIDIPLPIRTQDLVEVERDKTFVLKGRVSIAALKGCSLNAESLAYTSATLPAKIATVPKFLSLDAASRRLTYACERLLDFLNDPIFREFGVSQFGNRTLFEGFKKDLIAGINNARENPISTLNNAIVDSKSYANWLFIMSATHPQASFYPCIVGYALGFRMWLRATSSADSIENRFFTFLKSLPGSFIEVLPPTFRIGTDAIPKDVEAIFCFGSDDTLSQLKQLSALPISGFGSHLTVTCVHGSSQDTFKKLAKDCLSLAQKGCMSTRLIICARKYVQHDAEDFSNQLANACQPWVEHLSEPALNISLDHEWTEARLKKRAAFANKGLPLIYVYDESDLHIPKQELFSERNFVIPVIFVSPERLEVFLQQMRAMIPDLRLMTTDGSVKLDGIEMRCLGEGNNPAWNGTLENRPLFATDTEARI